MAFGINFDGDKMVDKKEVLRVISESASKISDDEWCDSCSWLYDMIVNGIEGIEEQKDADKR